MFTLTLDQLTMCNVKGEELSLDPAVPLISTEINPVFQPCFWRQQSAVFSNNKIKNTVHRTTQSL